MAKLDSLVNASACWIISRLVEDLEEGGGTPYLVSSATQFRLLAAKGVARRDSKWPFMMVSPPIFIAPRSPAYPRLLSAAARSALLVSGRHAVFLVCPSLVSPRICGS